MPVRVVKREAELPTVPKMALRKRRTEPISLTGGKKDFRSPTRHHEAYLSTDYNGIITALMCMQSTRRRCNAESAEVLIRIRSGVRQISRPRASKATSFFQRYVPYQEVMLNADFDICTFAFRI